MLDIDMAKSLVATFFLRYTHVPTYICMNIHTYNLYPNFLFFFVGLPSKYGLNMLPFPFLFTTKLFPPPFHLLPHSFYTCIICALHYLISFL